MKKSGKRLCSKGKPCGATCIAKLKTCRKELGAVSESIAYVRQEVEKTPRLSSPSQPPEKPKEESKEKVYFSGKNLVVGDQTFTPGITLPGSTSPVLYKDAEGKGQWVVKGGGAPGQNVAEKVANDVYNILGKPLGVGAVESRLTPDGKLVNKFIEGGKVVGDMSPKQLENSNAYNLLKRSHIADALVANWDFMGLNRDNVMVDPSGKVVRIDSGGTFNYRAQGAKKNYGAVPMEIWDLRARQGKYFWGTAEDKDYKDLWTRQVKAVGSQALRLKKTMESSDLPADVKKAFSQRMGTLMMAGNLISTVKINGQSIQQLADSGKISWKQVDFALKGAFDRSSKLDSSEKGWGKAVRNEIVESLENLF